jgi:hypothetical protein
MTSRTAVMGLFDTMQQADSTVVELGKSGFGKNDISVLYSNEPSAMARAQTRTHAHEVETENAVAAGAGAGGAVGGTLGFLAGLAAFAIPGLGPLVAAGPILGAFAGAATGAAAGGLAASLIELGVPEVQAALFEHRLRGGGHVLLSVHTDRGAASERARDILEHNGAREVVTIPEPARA